MCRTPNRCSSSITIRIPRSAELHVGTQEPMRADDDVDFFRRQVGQDGLLLLLVVWNRLSASTRTGKSAYRSPKVRRCWSARIVVGTRTATCRAGLHRLERRAHSDLRLAVADVADQQSVHRSHALHVRLDVGGRLALVGRVLEQERRFELPLPGAVGCVRRPVARPADARRGRAARPSFPGSPRACGRAVAPIACRRAGAAAARGASATTSLAARYRSSWSMR